MKRKFLLITCGGLLLLALGAVAICSYVDRNMEIQGSVEAQIRMEYLQAMLEVFSIDHGSYPTSNQGLKALIERPASLPTTLSVYPVGGYTKEDRLIDPWSRRFRYEADEDRMCYRLISLGEDGAQGGTGEAADLTLTCPNDRLEEAPVSLISMAEQPIVGIGLAWGTR